MISGHHHLDIIIIGPAVDVGPRGPRAINLLREPYQSSIGCKLILSRGGVQENHCSYNCHACGVKVV